MEELKSKIDYIIGCNPEVTEHTHNELSNSIYKLVTEYVGMCVIKEREKIRKFLKDKDYNLLSQQI